ncbi:MAG: methyltransferase domain-containing protein [Hydrogenophaga sp.]|uniref:class I SAM-dependent methyltransferase n=1 Tax=Hydrogenophaga sp. TaxID=1904254 RepID=UPI003D11DECF
MSAARFSADWLGLREPFDAAARDKAATRLCLGTRLAALRPPPGIPWRVIDLACGTGANLRWLAPRLGGPQEWLMVDHDDGLLRQVRHAVAGVSIVRQRLDLMTSLDTLPWHAAHLVTASALLDLVGNPWLHRLVAICASARVPLLLALSVDGRHIWSPEDALDAQIAALFAAHQRRDKGLGPALGSQAVATLRSALRDAGYGVVQARSDWRVDGRRSAADAPLLKSLIDGMADAAMEQDPGQATALRGWQSRRLARVVQTRLRVGHVDVLAWPSASGRAEP